MPSLSISYPIGFLALTLLACEEKNPYAEDCNHTGRVKSCSNAGDWAVRERWREAPMTKEDWHYNRRLVIPFFERSCDAGHQESCAKLGYHLAGEWYPIDPKRAFKLLEEACAENSSIGCGYLGLAYQNGWGTKPDDEKMDTSLAKACKLDPSLEICSE